MGNTNTTKLTLEEKKKRKAEYLRQYRAANKEKSAEYLRQYYAANKEEIAEKKRRYYAANKEKFAEQKRQYRAANQEKIAEQKRQWVAANQEKIAEKKRRYRAANKGIIAEKKRRYRAANQEKITQQQRQWRAANQEKIAEKKRERYRADKIYRLFNLVRNRQREALRGKHRGGSAVRDMGCTGQEACDHLESLFDDKMTWENWGTYWHLDHIYPLAAANLENRQEFLAVNNWRNLQPLEAKANIEKGDKVTPAARRLFNKLVKKFS